MRRHCDHNRLHWEGREGHCDQQSDQLVKLTPLLQVPKNWSGRFRTALFRALRLSLRLTFCGKRFATPQILIFAVMISHSSQYYALQRLSLLDCWQWLHRTFKCHFFWQNSYFVLSKLHFASSYMSGFPFLSDEWKSRTTTTTATITTTTKNQIKINQYVTAADDRRDCIDFAMSFAMHYG